MRTSSLTLLAAALAVGLAGCGATGPDPQPHVEVRLVSAGGFCIPELCNERLEIWSDGRATLAQGSRPVVEKQLDSGELRTLRALVHGREFRRLQRTYRGLCVDAPTYTLEVDQGGETQVVERIDCGSGQAVLDQAFTEVDKVRSLVLSPAPF